MVIDDSEESKEEVKIVVWDSKSLLPHSHVFAACTHGITNAKEPSCVGHEVFKKELLVKVKDMT